MVNVDRRSVNLPNGGFINITESDAGVDIDLVDKARNIFDRVALRQGILLFVDARTKEEIDHVITHLREVENYLPDDVKNALPKQSKSPVDNAEVSAADQPAPESSTLPPNPESPVDWSKVIVTGQTNPKFSSSGSGPASQVVKARAPSSKKLVEKWESVFRKVGIVISVVIGAVMILKYSPSPGDFLPLKWSIGIFVGTVVVYILFSGLGALFGYVVWLIRYPREKQPVAMSDKLEIPKTAENPIPPDEILKEENLHFKCPTCPNILSVNPQQIDSIVGINVACPACKNISHVPGGFKAEQTPSAKRITGGVRVPIVKFSDWYYENPVITSLIQRGQSDLLDNYGLWAFCSVCYHQFSATILTPLAIAQSMTKRGAGGFVFTARIPGSAKDMDALRSGHCSHCKGTSLIVIAAEIPDNVHNVIATGQKNTAYLPAGNTPRQKAGFPFAVSTKRFVIILAIVGIFALLFWAIFHPPDLSALMALISRPGAPSSLSTPALSKPTSVPPVQQNQLGGLCWTYELKNFDGNRSQVWENVLDDKTKKQLKYKQFIDDVVLQNPQLIDDGYVFYSQKTYKLPELCP
jgi:hypothetical protein